MLHALKEYAEAIGLESEPGFKPKEVKWLIVFNSKGQYVNVQRLGEKTKGEVFRKCPHLTQPELKGGGAGCRHFLVDGLDVISLLHPKDEPDEKQLAKHEFFLNLLDLAADVDPRLKQVHAGLRDSKQLDKLRSDLSGAKPKAKPADIASFAFIDSNNDAQSIIANDDSWHDWWRQHRSSMSAGKKKKAKDEQRLCFLTGETVEPASTHPKITGLASVGGMAAGDVYASFKQDSFQSYGLSQSSNAALSEDAAKLYTTALNHLIRERSIRLAGSRIAYWYLGESEVPTELDPVENVLNGLDLSEFQSEPPDSEQQLDDHDDVRPRAQAELAAHSLLAAIKGAEREDLLEAEFRSVTLSANSGRVVIRDWMEGQFKDFATKVDCWFADLRIVRRDGDGNARAPKFLAVLAGTVRDLKDITSPTEVAMWRAAVRGSPIPSHLAANALARFRIDLIQDRPTSHAQIGLLKAFCIRQSRQGNSHMPQITTELNKDTDHPAYVAGRILALLGQIQKKALPGVNVGVVERYYASASTSPALILGRLIRTALIAHLPKIEPDGLQFWFDKQLASLVAILNESPKRTLTMEEQTLFALGYYQQKANRYSKGKSESEDS